MPPGTPYNSFVRPYPIRVDEFSVPRDGSLTVAALHLLTHTHSDHIVGLNAKSFGSIVICSGDAKEMLLRHETYQARFLREEEYVIEKQRTFGHLKFSTQSSREARIGGCNNYDLIRAMPLHVPTKVEISNNEWVTVTLIDANHCPGSVMFLIQGSKGAILHTGDFRAEPIFIGSIVKNPFLRHYIARSASPQSDDSRSECSSETLEAIYLDTASMLNTATIPAKKEATSGLIELMKAYPVHMRFFINTWTWGYEDILKAISCSFESKIHVDRYKHDVYSSLSDRDLRALVTQDFKSTRFHACERFSRCDLVRNEDPGVVYINPVNISCANWDLYLAKTRAQLERGELPMLLLVPLHRHSTLPELQNFVSLFKPRRLVPNFLEPSLHGLDWTCMPAMFGPYMAEGGARRIQEEMAEKLSLADIKDVEVNAMIADSELKNLEGGNASDELDTLVGIWAAAPGAVGGSLSAGGLISRLMGFLPKGISALVERALRDAPRQKLLPTYLESDEDDADSSSDEEGSGRMAELLFGGHLNLPPEGESLEDANEDSQQTDSVSKGRDMKVGSSPQAIQLPFTPPGSSPMRRSRRRPLETTWNASNMSDPYDIGLRRGVSADMTTISRADGLVFAKVPMPGADNGNGSGQCGVSCCGSATSSIMIGTPTQGNTASQQDNSDIAELASTPAATQVVPNETTKSKSEASSLFSAPPRMTKRHTSQDSLRKGHKEKRLKKEARLELSHRLSLARPDLANQRTPSQKLQKLHKGASSSSSSAASEHRPQGAAASRTRPHESLAGANSDCDPNINWARSRSLEKQILEDLRMGKKPSLPSMKFVLSELFPDE